MFGVFDTRSGTPNPYAAINHDYIISEKNNYTTRPTTFSGDSTEFEWWKSKMYTNIIGHDNELWDMEDGIDIPANGVRMVSDKKKLSHQLRKKLLKAS